MKTILSLLVSLLLLMSGYSQEIYQHGRLTLLWETTEGLKTTESVLFDPTENVLYVASINENPWKKDGNGYISKLTTDGKVLSARWATGLSAPKGMGILNGRLYVTNIDEVAEIDLKTGKIINRFTHPEAVNLNDIAVNPDGQVYVSDSKGNCIFHLLNNKMEIFTDSPQVKGSNGLCIYKRQLLCGQDNSVVAINLLTKEVTTLIENTGGIDGIEVIGKGTFLISDWSGHVYMAEPGKEKFLLLDTTPVNKNAADIGYNRSEGILYVPTFFSNGVTAYRLD